jgi:hypothetical protein
MKKIKNTAWIIVTLPVTIPMAALAAWSLG